MNEIVTLNDLCIDERCVVSKVNCKGIMRRRVMDIGIIPGTIIECIFYSPSGNPKAYRIKDSLIALRNEDASMIEVKLI